MTITTKNRREIQKITSSLPHFWYRLRVAADSVTDGYPLRLQVVSVWSHLAWSTERRARKKNHEACNATADMLVVRRCISWQVLTTQHIGHGCLPDDHQGFVQHASRSVSR